MILFWFQNDISDNCEIERVIGHHMRKLFPKLRFSVIQLRGKNSTTALPGARYRDTKAKQISNRSAQRVFNLFNHF